MTYKDWDLPVPYHETFDILDASKIQTFMDSPRRFFYNYILGWRPDEPNVHLVFGSAWHEAMEYMMNNVGNYTDATIIQAWELFNDMYVAEYPDPWMHDSNGPKVPENALKALTQYAQEYRHDDFETLFTEIAGSVPIHLNQGESDPRADRVLHFKLDSAIRKEDGSIWSMEHKTTGRKTQSWVDKWAIIPQVFLYTHALRSYYGSDAKGIIINGAVLRKVSNEFLRVPVTRPDDMMQAGLESLNHWVDQIEWNMKMLLEDSPSNTTMYSFPCNSMSCTKFGCAYSSFCALWPNPLQKIDSMPVGFKEDRWDPRRSEDRAKKIIHMEKMTT